MTDTAKHEVEREDWCARLEHAVTDGRFLEDPAHWRAHVAACPQCRKTVEGVFLLRDFVGQARMDEDLGDQPPLVGEEVVAQALDRHRAERQRLLTLWGMGAAVLLAVGGVFLFTREPAPPPATARTQAEALGAQALDPDVARVVAIQKRIARPGLANDYELVRRDETLRNELLSLLESPSSYARRNALFELASAGIELPARRIEEFLTTFDETLDRPVTTATSAGEAGRMAREALAVQRTSTLEWALASALSQAANGLPPVRHGAITPFYAHPEARIRVASLQALEWDKTYVPGDAEERLFADDTDPAVRVAAGLMLLKRLEEQGSARVVARLRARPDWAIEEGLAGSLGRFPDGLAFARERTDDPATPIAPALLYALALAGKGERAAALRLVPRAVADGDAHAVEQAILVARRLALHDVREAMQARWRRDQEEWRRRDPQARRNIADGLVLWDEAMAEEPRLHWALDVIQDQESDLSYHAREVLQRLSTSPVTSVQRRARSLQARAAAGK